MKKIKYLVSCFSIVSHLLRWTLLIIPVAVSVGSLVALFLWLLDKATNLRYANSWLLYLLPLAGVIIYFLYHLFGKTAEKGNNLIIDEIHQPGGGIPAEMALLVIITTVITHLFGGSAGREGTAVQVGGSLAHAWGKWFRLNSGDHRIILMGGIAAGFGAVFGTPLAGAIFALEVLAIGQIRYDALIPCLIAGVFADITCAAWGIHHTPYSIAVIRSVNHTAPFIPVDLFLLVKVIVASVAFGLTSYLFSALSHAIKSYSNQWISIKWLIPVVGGGIIIFLAWLLGTSDYLGLGVTNPDAQAVTILSSFHPGGAHPFSWFWKLLFTAITLGMGFKGGEVTPLFFIGAALGNTIGLLTGTPVDLMAGLGFIAVFAGATNTPIACTIMGVELFGGGYILYYAIACFTAYYCSGPSGIYTSQRLAIAKGKWLIKDS